jgi:hypothetical protein
MYQCSPPKSTPAGRRVEVPVGVDLGGKIRIICISSAFFRMNRWVLNFGFDIRLKTGTSCLFVGSQQIRDNRRPVTTGALSNTDLIIE